MYPWCQLGLGGLAIPELERRLNFGREQARAAVKRWGNFQRESPCPSSRRLSVIPIRRFDTTQRSIW